MLLLVAVAAQRKGRLILACLTLLVGCGMSHPPADGAFDGAVPQRDGGHPDGGHEPDDAGPDAASRADARVDGGPPDLGPAFDRFCREYLTLRMRGQDCCTLGSARTTALDEDQIDSICTRLSSDSALRDGSLGLNTEAADQRLASLESALDGCAAVERDWSYSNILRGDLAAGEDCTPDGLFFQSLGIYRCRDGLRCEVSGTVDAFVGTCRPPGEEGETCYHDCAPGLYCAWWLKEDTDPFWGRCVPRDDACMSSDHACSTSFCDDLSGMCVDPDAPETWCAVLG